MSVPSVCLESKELLKQSHISVALCTYNGAKYLGEQLASIGAQTVRTDELVICDDASTDDSVAVARRCADTAPFPVTICQSPRNLGSRDNFSKCIAACTGQIIVRPDKKKEPLRERLLRVYREASNRVGKSTRVHRWTG